MKIFYFRIILISTFYFFIFNGYSQNSFDIAVKSGIVFPFAKFHRNVKFTNNGDFNYIKKEGLLASINSNISINTNDRLSLNFLYETFSLTLQENVKLPEDFIIDKLSYYNSSFNNKNIGLGVSYSRKLYMNHFLNCGLQYSIPINSNDGFLYVAGLNRIVENYTYTMKNKFAFVSNFEIHLGTIKKIDININPAFTYFFTKTYKTYDLENQLNQYYFSLLFGFTLK